MYRETPAPEAGVERAVRQEARHERVRIGEPHDDELAVLLDRRRLCDVIPGARDRQVTGPRGPRHGPERGVEGPGGGEAGPRDVVVGPVESRSGPDDRPIILDRKRMKIGSVVAGGEGQVAAPAGAE